jgi:hypothetical protein
MRYSQTLIVALRDEGHKVEELRGARDESGEDALLKVDDRRMVVQVVTMSAEKKVWAALAESGSHSREGDLSEAVALVRGALMHKRLAKAALVVLDAANFGALVGRRLVEAYRAAYASPVDEFSFAEVWIIGLRCHTASASGEESASTVAFCYCSSHSGSVPSRKRASCLSLLT